LTLIPQRPLDMIALERFIEALRNAELQTNSGYWSAVLPH